MVSFHLALNQNWLLATEMADGRLEANFFHFLNSISSNLIMSIHLTENQISEPRFFHLFRSRFPSNPALKRAAKADCFFLLIEPTTSDWRC